MRISFNSPVILLFIVTSCLELFLSTISLGATDFFFTSPTSFNFLNPFNWTGSVMHVFGHMNFQHLSGNMIFILLLGPILEEKYGSFRLLVMIVITALLTSFFNIVMFGNALLGASGIVFMMIILSSYTNVKSGTVPLTFILVIVLYLGKEFFGSLVPSNVSHFAHILGGCFGGVFGIMFSRSKNS